MTLSNLFALIATIGIATSNVAYAESVKIGYRYVDDGIVGSIDAFETGQIDLNRLPSLKQPIRFNAHGLEQTKTVFQTRKDGDCDVVKKKDSRIGHRGAVLDERYPVKFCLQEVFYTDKGPLLYVGLAPVAMEVVGLSGEVLAYEAMAIFHDKKAQKDFYFDAAEVNLAMLNSREFAQGKAISAPGFHRGGSMHALVPRLAIAMDSEKAKSVAKGNLQKTCEEFFGGRVISEISLEITGHDPGTRRTHSLASGVCQVP